MFADVCVGWLVMVVGVLWVVDGGLWCYGWFMIGVLWLLLRLSILICKQLLHDVVFAWVGV